MLAVLKTDPGNKRTCAMSFNVTFCNYPENNASVLLMSTLGPLLTCCSWTGSPLRVATGCARLPPIPALNV